MFDNKVIRLEEDYKKDLDFYTRIGCTAKQAKYFASHIFNQKVKHFTKEELKKEREKDQREMAKGSFGFSAAPLRGAPKAIVNKVSTAFFTAQTPDPMMEFCESCDESDFATVDSLSISVESQEKMIDHDIENYNPINEEGFRDTKLSPLSTFSGTVNTASMNNIRDKVSYNGAITKDMVRIEEMLNFFDYEFSSPAADNKFKINIEIGNKINSTNKLMLVGIKGRQEETPRQNIVLLLDTSGSMGTVEKMINTQKSIVSVVKNMSEGDLLSLIGYSSHDKVYFTGLRIDKNALDNLAEKLKEVDINGCTNGSAGLDMAYSTAEKLYIESGVNRVLLFTDGDFNFGEYSTDSIAKLAKEKRKTNVFITCLGFGCGEYSDKIMEAIAKNGNGNYFKITDDFDIEELLHKKINSTLVPIAKDIKVQVEFNPNVVAKYRLIGYENRRLNAEDFKNDKVEAEPVGSGHTVVALYEIELRTDETDSTKLKYQEISYNNNSDVCTVSVNYKEPDETESKTIEERVEGSRLRNGKLVTNLKIAYAVMLIAEDLRDSEYNYKGSITDALDLIDSLPERIRNTRKIQMLRGLRVK